MGYGSRTEQNRLWAWVAGAALVAIALLIVDPFASDSGLTGEDDSPFVAVLGSRSSDDVDNDTEVLDVVIERDDLELSESDGDRGLRVQDE